MPFAGGKRMISGSVSPLSSSGGEGEGEEAVFQKSAQANAQWYNRLIAQVLTDFEPLSRLMSERIGGMRNRAKRRWRDATAPVAEDRRWRLPRTKLQRSADKQKPSKPQPIRHAPTGRRSFAKRRLTWSWTGVWEGRSSPVNRPDTSSSADIPPPIP